jgi:predicted tellurium resistance membrane protein TerC
MEIAIALVALTAMEIVLGIDNIVFIAILTDRLPVEQRSGARRVGLGIAMIMRIILLLCISWVMGLTTPMFEWTDIGAPESWFTVEDHATGPDGETLTEVEIAIKSKHLEDVRGVSGRDLILLLGGLFLIVKTVKEVHEETAGEEHHAETAKVVTFQGALIQIALLDLVFSLDSVITAVGMVDEVWVMIVAVIISVGVMVLFADKVSNFVSTNPSLKMLALNFLLLIGVMLLAEGAGTHVEKGYIYFAMAFSLIVEVLNIKVRSKTEASTTTASIE